MLSAGSGPPRFSPSQNIRVILSLPSYGNVHYRQLTLIRLVLRAGDGDRLSSRTVFLLSRMSPSSEVCRSRPCAKSTHWISQRQAGSCAIPS